MVADRDDDQRRGRVMAIYKNGEIYRGEQQTVSSALTSDLKVNHEIAVIMQTSARLRTLNDTIRKIVDMDDYDVRDTAKLKIIKSILGEGEENGNNEV